MIGMGHPALENGQGCLGVRPLVGGDGMAVDVGDTSGWPVTSSAHCPRRRTDTEGLVKETPRPLRALGPSRGGEVGSEPVQLLVVSLVDFGHLVFVQLPVRFVLGHDRDAYRAADFRVLCTCL